MSVRGMLSCVCHEGATGSSGGSMHWRATSAVISAATTGKDFRMGVTICFMVCKRVGNVGKELCRKVDMRGGRSNGMTGM